MTLREGERVAARFTVVKVLGEGGMGVVYEVRDGKFRDQRRALKTLKPGREADAALRKRFVDEVEATARIQSEHVIQVVDYDNEAAAPWMLMELLDGETLDEHVRACGPLPLEDARTRLVELGHALREAHRAGVLHLDLKPSNLFLARSADAYGTTRLKVLDFGISRQIRDGKTHVKQSRAIGSEAWMPYEQFNKGAELRPQSDVWSFGLLAFWMLTAKHYWPDVDDHGDIENLGTLLGDIHQGATVPASVRAAERGATRTLPEGFDAWFARCVAADPKQRWDDGGVASRALDEVLVRASRGVSSAPPPVATPTPSPPPPTRVGTAEVARPLPPSGFTEPVRQVPPERPIVAVPPVVPPPAVKPSRAPWIAAGGTLAVVVAAALVLRGCPTPPPQRDAGAEVAEASVVVLPPREPTCPEGMALIRGGTFRMGSPDGTGESDEHPEHDVTLESFCIDRTEASVTEYSACVTAGHCTAPRGHRHNGGTNHFFTWNRPNGADSPVNGLDWQQAKTFCEWSGNPRGVGRMLREAEWEFAARGTAGRTYPWGDVPPDGTRANLCGAECAAYAQSLGLFWPAIPGWRDSFGETAPANSFELGATPEGVRNLAGNMWEWVEDVYAPDAYARHAPDGQLRVGDGSGASLSTGSRVVRGGGWLGLDRRASATRAANRHDYDPRSDGLDVGVRCARGVY